MRGEKWWKLFFCISALPVFLRTHIPIHRSQSLQLQLISNKKNPSTFLVARRNQYRPTPQHQHPHTNKPIPHSPSSLLHTATNSRHHALKPGQPIPHPLYLLLHAAQIIEHQIIQRPTHPHISYSQSHAPNHGSVALLQSV